MQIERSELRAFQAVVAAAGFSRAAERLGLSQSAVSQAIANLEHKLGTPLLRRGTPPQLTEAGIRLLRFAETTLNEEADALSEIDAIRTGALDVVAGAVVGGESALRRRVAAGVQRAQSADEAEGGRGAVA